MTACEKEFSVETVKTAPFEIESNFIESDANEMSPFNVVNMQNAIIELKQQDRYSDLDMQIDTSHVYLEFSLSTEEYAELDVDTSILLFDHPLWDYDQCLEFDPTDSETQESDKAYSVVTFGELSSIEAPYTIIEYLHLPGETEEGMSEEISDDYETYIYDLDKAAYNLLGCYFPDDEEPDIQARKSSWNPEGRVQVEEALRIANNATPAAVSGKLLPVVGVKVTSRKVFRWRSDYTDSGGRYRMGFQRGKARYRIFWESSQVKVTDGTNIVRKHVGPRVRNEEWNPIYRWMTDEFVSATMINGSHQFELLRRGHSMTSPWRPSNLVNIRTIYSQGTGRMVFIGQTLKIWSRNSYSDDGNNSNKTTDQLYRVLFHELGHFAHYRQVGAIHFSNSDACVRESFGQVVENVMTTQIYSHMSARTAEQDRTYEEMEEDGYTSVFIDLIDNFDQYDASLPDDYPQDIINGYSLSEIVLSLNSNQEITECYGYLRDSHPKPYQTPVAWNLFASFYGCMCQSCD